MKWTIALCLQFLALLFNLIALYYNYNTYINLVARFDK